MKYEAIIAAVFPDSIASEIGLVPGDRLLAVNGQKISDIIDLSFALSDEEIILFVGKQDGEQEEIEIEKEYDEDLGIEFESAVFDGVKRCANHCVFCFVDQMPSGMRESLYVKDDDYRLSFLYGNFITLSNLTKTDIARIKKLHLSPLYVSVHTTDGPLRQKMLNLKRAGDIMQQIKDLLDAGIEIHTQVVLCPGINDGDNLQKTIQDLYQFYPNVLSMAIVPVGLTKYRENCHQLSAFTPEQASEVVDMVEKWQLLCRKERGISFVYLGDEFYLASGRSIPNYECYDGFPQLENGVGLVRNFLSEWQAAQENIQKFAGYSEPHYLDILCGLSAQKILQPLLENLKIKNLIIHVLGIENTFFGPHITVSGLLTGKDIISNLHNADQTRTGIIIPGASLRKGEDIFLDGITTAEMAEIFKVPVRVAYSASDLYHLLTEWK